MSVVIPSRDRPTLLADCLKSLSEQDPPGGSWEVIVVDDGSAEPLAATVEGMAGDGLPVRCIRQAPAGLNVARNTGVEAAEGEFVAFLDDDTLVQAGWARALHRGFAENGCDVLGGRVLLHLEDGGELPRWLTERRLTYLSHYDLGEAPCGIDKPPLPVGANFAVRRRLFETLGGFRPGLDRIGRELISNGEWELQRRILDSGGRLLYWPEATVLHRVPAERLTKEWFRRRARAQGVSDVRTDPVEEGSSYMLRVAREAARAGRALPILLRRVAEHRGSFDAELWLIACRARVDELRAQRRAA